MKSSMFAILLVIGSAVALPEAQIKPSNSRFIVEGQFRSVIEQLRQGIRNAGLDPLTVYRYEYTNVYIPFLVELNAVIENLLFVGASDIVINNVDYSAIFNRLRFDIVLPQISLTVCDASMTANVFGTKYKGEAKGSLSIRQVRLIAEVRVDIGIISGISIRSLNLNFSVGSIESDISLVALGTDYSDDVNRVLNETIPALLKIYENDINELLETVVRFILDAIL